MTKERARQKAAKYLEWAEKAEKKSKETYDAFQAVYKDFDWTQPILLGHHSQKRHQRVYEKRNSMHEKVRELDEKAKRFREKADNLLRFANTNKGDAERRREKIREELDKVVKVGDIIITMYGEKEVLKINKKSYTVQGSVGTFTVPKHLLFGTKIKQ